MPTRARTTNSWVQVSRQVAVAADNALNSEAARPYERLAPEHDWLRALLEINKRRGHMPGRQAAFPGDLGVATRGFIEAEGFVKRQGDKLNRRHAEKDRQSKPESAEGAERNAGQPALC